MIRVSGIVGARPNFMKMAPIQARIRNHPQMRFRLIHTGQHYSADMSDTFFDDLSMPPPDVNLEVGSGTHAWQTAAIMVRLEPEFMQQRPDLLLVVGDVNSTMAATLVAAKMEIPVAHVEAGLRSFDRRMPEEINRIVTDALSDYLFVSEPSGVTNLFAEGIPRGKIFLVGNVMIDTLLRLRAKALESDVLRRFGLTPGQYCIATLHRPSNVDDAEQLPALAAALTELSRRLPVVFPVHPRTRARLQDAGVSTNALLVTGPLGYLDFLGLMAQSRLVLTDSGGIQEETTVLNVPCLTLRENTERPITVEQGTNRLVGCNPQRILSAALEALSREQSFTRRPDLWDGEASARILDVIESSFQLKTTAGACAVVAR